MNSWSHATLVCTSGRTSPLWLSIASIHGQAAAVSHCYNFCLYISLHRFRDLFRSANKGSIHWFETTNLRINDPRMQLTYFKTMGRIKDWSHDSLLPKHVMPSTRASPISRHTPIRSLLVNLLIRTLLTYGRRRKTTPIQGRSDSLTSGGRQDRWNM